MDEEMFEKLHVDINSLMVIMTSACTQMGINAHEYPSYTSLWEKVVTKLKPKTVNKLIQLMIEDDYNLSDDLFGFMYGKLVERSKSIH